MYLLQHQYAQKISPSCFFFFSSPLCKRIPKTTQTQIDFFALLEKTQIDLSMNQYFLVFCLDLFIRECSHRRGRALSWRRQTPMPQSAPKRHSPWFTTTSLNKDYDLYLLVVVGLWWWWSFFVVANLWWWSWWWTSL